MDDVQRVDHGEPQQAPSFPLLYVHHVHYQPPEDRRGGGGKAGGAAGGAGGEGGACFHLLCFTKRSNDPDNAIAPITLRISDFPFFAYIEVPPEHAQNAEWKQWVKDRGRQISQESRKKCNGYHRGETVVWKLSYTFLPALKKWLSDCNNKFSQRLGVKIWEDNFDPDLRLMQVLDFKVGTWYRWPENAGIYTHSCEMLQSLTPHSDLSVIPLVTCAFDLETSGLYVQQGHTISMIGMVMYNMLTHERERLLLHVHPAYAAEEAKEKEEDAVPTTFIQCEDEAAMLMMFRDVMVDRKVSVMMGHNTTSFDWKFLFARAEMLQLSSQFRRMSWWGPEIYSVQEWEPKLRNRRGLVTIGIPGVYCLDTLVLALTQRKLPQYTLNAVAADVLGEGILEHQKHEMDVKMLVQCVKPDFDPTLRYRVGLYCVQDCDLVQKIVQTIDSVSFLIMMSALCYCQPHHVLYYGTTKPILSILMREFHHCNKLCNHSMAQSRRYNSEGEVIVSDDMNILTDFGDGAEAEEAEEDEEEDGEGEGGGSGSSSASSSPSRRGRDMETFMTTTRRGRILKYEGGAVFEPLIGVHEDVEVLDFQSLYPSMMMAYDLCMCNWTLQKPPDHIPHLTVDLETNESQNEIRFIYFVIAEDPNELIIPRLQHQFSSGRSHLKKMMKKYKKGSVQYRRYDTEQLAMKLVGNGTYGALGILVPEVAIAVTAQGRMTIRKSIEIAVQQFGVQLVYGDTDSMFVCDTSTHRDVDTYEGRKASFDHMQQISDAVNAYWNECPTVLHKGIINLEPEAVCKATYHEKKKMYCKSYFSRPEDEVPKLEVKGMVTTRRDIPVFVQVTVKEVLAKLLKGRGAIMDVIRYIQNRVNKLQEYISGVTKDDIGQFVTTREIKKWKYASPSPAVTVAIRNKLRGREPGHVIIDEYGIGDRVPILVLQKVQQRLYSMLQCPDVPVEALMTARINDLDLDTEQVRQREFYLPQFGQYGLTNKWTVKVTGVDPNAFQFHPHHFFFNGIRCSTIEWVQTVARPTELTLVLYFSVSPSSTALHVEDPDSLVPGRRYPLNARHYVGMFVRPLQRIVGVLIATQSMFAEIEQDELGHVNQLLDNILAQSIAKYPHSLVPTSRQSTLHGIARTGIVMADTVVLATTTAQSKKRSAAPEEEEGGRIETKKGRKVRKKHVTAPKATLDSFWT